MIAYSDLASERRRASSSMPGVTLEKEQHGAVETERLTVTSEEGAREMGVPCGVYLTTAFPPPQELTGSEEERLACTVKRQLTELAGGAAEKGVLVLGLGNRHMTADAIGPLTADGVHATNHLRICEEALFNSLDCHAVSVFCPGVLAQTGMEVAELARAAVKTIQPGAVLAIDALAARSKERLMRTVQICNTGITPGSGIGNRRTAISRDTLGVPVVAVGVPTVADASVIVRDAFKDGGMDELPPAVEEALGRRGSYFVSPKDCDVGVQILARVLSDAINRAFGISLHN